MNPLPFRQISPVTYPVPSYHCILQKPNPPNSRHNSKIHRQTCTIDGLDSPTAAVDADVKVLCRLLLRLLSLAQRAGHVAEAEACAY